MAITNTALPVTMPCAVKLDGTTAVTLTLNPDLQYDLEHTALAEDFSTGAAVSAYCTVAREMETPAAAAIPAGVQGFFWLKTGTTKRIGPGLTGLSMKAVSAANPVVQVIPLDSARA